MNYLDSLQNDGMKIINRTVQEVYVIERRIERKEKKNKTENNIDLLIERETHLKNVFVIPKAFKIFF